MSIGKIVAPLTGAPRDKIVLETAFVAAKPFAAHVVALYVHPDPRLAMPYMGTPLSPDVVQAIIDSTMEVSRNAAKAARAAAVEAGSAADVPLVVAAKKSPTTTCSFREMEGYFPQCVAEASRLSDLVVFGPVEASDGPDLSDAFVQTLMATERPVLLTLHAPRTPFAHVAIGWDGGPASARALAGALPFVERAERVSLFACRPKNAPKPRLDEVIEYIALHGRACTVQIIDPGKAGIGETLLDAAKTSNADLLVMGGYGHSHLGETLFGGVTHYVRWHAEIPVLMVH